MLVTCPSCEANYELGPEALGGGRRLRCARCRNDWFAEGPPSPIFGLEDAPPIVAIDVPEVMDAIALPPDEDAPTKARKSRRPVFRLLRRRASGSAVASAGRSYRPTPRRRSTPRVRPTAAFAALCFVAFAAMIVGRAPVVRSVPSLASLYEAVGLDVNVRGLAIRDVRSVEQVDEGVPLLLVTGSIANVSDAALDVPRLRLAVTSGDDRELYAWTTVAGRPKLSPGEQATFRARLASPPAEGQAIAVRFLARQDLAARAIH